jgi:hypothetical protein
MLIVSAAVTMIVILISSFVRALDYDVTHIVDNVRVIAVAANHSVGAGSTVESVVSSPAEQPVIAGQSLDIIIASASPDDVISVRAD